MHDEQKNKGQTFVNAIFMLMLASIIALMLQGCGSAEADTSDIRNGSAYETDEYSGAEGNSEEGVMTSSFDASDITYDSDDTWAVYWYLCGSDLESNGGYATTDLEEMMSCSLPDNVKVVIQTGGSSSWQNDFVDPNLLQRFEYRGDTLYLVDEQPLASMGDQGTLEEFLSYCTTNYPANHKVLVFWNHGGGSLGGVAYDENFGNDSLSLNEIEDALMTTKDAEALRWANENPPTDDQMSGLDDIEFGYMYMPQVFEVIGFDACLMATIDSAQTVRPYANYMVASEETEPGNGWYYQWLGVLGENTAMNGAELGKVICDTFVEGCEAVGTQDSITLSVVDLSKISDLSYTFESMGTEMLKSAIESSSVVSEFARSAESSLNYGGNSNVDGYTDMVDFGDLIENSAYLVPELSEDLLNGISEAVVYHVNGPYTAGSTGLSVFYPYDGSLDSVDTYAQNRFGNLAYMYFTRYMVGGDVSEASSMLDYLELDFEDLEPMPTFEEDMPIEITDENYARLSLDPSSLDAVKSVFFNLAFYSEADDIIIFLGSDNDLYADWENGIFEDNFRGVWGSINGELCYMEITYEGDDYNLYSIPVLLNDEEMVLRVVYDFDAEAFEILGAKESIDEGSMMADKDLVLLASGDVITPIMYATSFSDENSDVFEFYMDEIYVDDDLSFYETDLGDGEFAFSFEVVDLSNNTYDSDIAFFEYEDGEIYILTE